MNIRKVKGVQSEGALLRFGLIKITKPCAKECWEAGMVVVIAGNKVDASKLFSSERLSAKIHNRMFGEEFARTLAFDEVVNQWKLYLSPEDGNQVVFFAFKDELKKKGIKL